MGPCREEVFSFFLHFRALGCCWSRRFDSMDFSCTCSAPDKNSALYCLEVLFILSKSLCAALELLIQYYNICTRKAQCCVLIV